MTDQDPAVPPVIPGSEPEAPPPPRKVDDVDALLTRNLRSAHRIRWIMVAAVFTLMAGAIAAMALVIAQQQDELHSSCYVWRILSPQPVTIMKGATRPTPLGVSLIAGARDAFAGQRCGNLPPADPSLVKWAKFYGIPLP
jgi:hypothetical protein